MAEKPEPKNTPKEKEFQNLMIECVDCGHNFVWTAGEQEFYRDRNLDQPKRCHKCRFLRRQKSQGNVRVLEGNPEPAKVEKAPSKKEDKSK